MIFLNLILFIDWVHQHCLHFTVTPTFSAKSKHTKYPVTSLGSTPGSLAIVLLKMSPCIYALSPLSLSPRPIAHPIADDRLLHLLASVLNAATSTSSVGPTAGFSNGMTNTLELYLYGQT